jgi:hypothetical protein
MNALRWLGGLSLAVFVSQAFGADRQKIILPEVEVRSGPTSAYYATSKLRQGDEVEILDVEQDMLKIVPPPGSFDWVSDADVKLVGTDVYVTKPTALRRGSNVDPVNFVDVALIKLEPGTQLGALPGIPQKAGKELLIKVRPPTNDVRYIPRNAVAAPPGGNASSAGVNFPKIPGYGQDSFSGTPAPAFAAPATSTAALATQNSQQNSAPSFQVPATQTTPTPAFGNQSPPPVLRASYDPPQDTRRNELLAPTFPSGVNRQDTRGSTAPKVPDYSTSALSVSRSTQMTGSLTDDPDWVEGERLEEFYAQTKDMGDIKQAISHYDTVGKKYGQIDPALALRAMNRAQYLRNAVSAGVIPQSAVSRSAKPNYADTANTEAYPNGSGRSNVETRQTRNKTAQSDVYPEAPKYLPSEASATTGKNDPTKIDLTQPSARLDKPLTGNQVPPKGAQTVVCPGILEATTLEFEHKKIYRLRPDDQNIAPFIYCTNTPGINLEEVLNKHVEITGLFYLHKSVNQYYIEATNIRYLAPRHQ